MPEETSDLPADAASAPRPSAAPLTLRSFDRSLPMALLKAREIVMRQFRPSLRRFGITEQQWRVLRALTTVEQIEIMALAEATFLLPPSLSRILRDLEDRGLIQRRPAPSDLRRGLISISEQGLSLIEQAGVQSELIYAAIARRFGAERMQALHGLLAELEQSLADLSVPGQDAGEDDSEAPPRTGRNSRR